MSWHEFAEHETLAVAIVTSVTTIIVAILGYFMGGWGFLRERLTIWLDDRRKRMTPPVPTKTLHVVVDKSQNPPLWSKDDGKSATRCIASFLITNRLQRSSVMAKRAEVVLRGLDRLRRKRYEVCFMGSAIFHPARPYEIIEANATAHGCSVSFYVRPEIPQGKKLRADIIIYDAFDNPHVAKNVCFTSGRPDALPDLAPPSAPTIRS